MAYKAFGLAVRDINKHDSAPLDHERLLRKSLNINFEWSVLTETQHIIDELHIMQDVFNQQLAVVRDLNQAMDRNAKYGKQVCERAGDLIEDIGLRIEELAGLERLATKIRLQVSASSAHETFI